MKKLPELFMPEVASSLEDSQIDSIASESNESTVKRARANEKLRVLELASRELKRLNKQSVSLQGSSSTRCYLESQSNCFEGLNRSLDRPPSLERNYSLESDLESRTDTPSIVSSQIDTGTYRVAEVTLTEMSE